MPAEFWYPITGATHDLPAGYDDYTNSGGANKNASTRVGGGRAGPATHDDGTSSVQMTQDGATTFQQSLNGDWPGPVAGVSAFTAALRRQAFTAASSTRIAFSSSAGTLGSTVATESTLDAVYHDAGPSNAMSARPGGGAWTGDDFANEQITFPTLWSTGSASGFFSVTSVWGLLTYTPAAGGFVFLLQLAGLGALPFVGAMDFGHFVRFLSWRRRCHPRHTILTGDEVRQAWRELREYRHPRFFLPAV